MQQANYNVHRERIDRTTTRKGSRKSDHLQKVTLYDKDEIIAGAQVS